MTKKTIELAKKYSDGLIRERDLVRKDMVKSSSKLNDWKFLIFFLKTKKVWQNK